MSGNPTILQLTNKRSSRSRSCGVLVSSFAMTQNIGRVAARQVVQAVVKPDLYDEILDYCCGEPCPRLWGIEPGDRSGISDTLVVALYHDITGEGFTKLSKRTQGWYKHASATLTQNIQVIRRDYGSWGRGSIDRGDRHDWRSVSRTFKYDRKTIHCDLKMDSGDIKIEGKNRRFSRIPVLSP